MFTYVYTTVLTHVNTSRLPAMPREPMVHRTLRVPRAVWEAAQERAEREGEHLSEAIRRFLERYGKG